MSGQSMGNGHTNGNSEQPQSPTTGNSSSGPVSSSLSPLMIKINLIRSQFASFFPIDSVVRSSIHKRVSPNNQQQQNRTERRNGNTNNRIVLGVILCVCIVFHSLLMRTETRYLNLLIATEDFVLANITLAIPSVSTQDTIVTVDDGDDENENIEHPRDYMILNEEAEEAVISNLTIAVPSVSANATTVTVDDDDDEENDDIALDSSDNEGNIEHPPDDMLLNEENEEAKEQNISENSKIIEAVQATVLSDRSKLLYDRLNQTLNTRNELFLEQKTIAIGDVYSGMWWQSIENILKVNTDRMTYLEAATFATISGKIKRVTMAKNVLDLCVEHLSTFFRYLRFDIDFPNKEKDYDHCLQSLQNYTQRVLYHSPYHYRYQIPSNMSNSFIGDTIVVPKAFRDTVAIIPFGLRTTFKAELNGPTDPSNQLRYESLIATMMSIWQIGIGRIVVVGGDSQEEFDGVHQVFDQFYTRIDQSLNESIKDTPGDIIIVNKPTIELGFAGGHTNLKNLPREAISGIKQAFQYVHLLTRNSSTTTNETNTTSDSTKNEMVTFVEKWLGTDQSTWTHWRFIYFSEPDLILHTRPETMSHLGNELEMDRILMSHRLQLLQHESDFPDFVDKSLSIPSLGQFENVTTLDSYNSDRCLLNGRNDKEGMKKPRCRKLWWRCGFGHASKHNYSDVKDIEGLFRLYLPFNLIRLHQGTRLVSISGTQQRKICDIQLNYRNRSDTVVDT